MRLVDGDEVNKAVLNGNIFSFDGRLVSPNRKRQYRTVHITCTCVQSTK